MKQTTLGGMQWLRKTAGLVGLAAGAAFVAPADAADVCISQKAKDTLSTCPGGKLETNTGKKPQVSFKNAPTAIETKKREDTKKPINPSGTMAAASRDERVARTQARREELLTKEILETDALLRQTKKTDTKDRPKLLRRLAESYVELESAAFRKRTELQTKIEDGKRAKQDTAALEKQLKDADATVNTARSEAISNYTKLKTDFPKFCLSGNTGCGDEVLYYLAYEYEQAGKMEQARDTYQELIKNFKTSPFIPNAYFAFGELYFNLAQQDATNWSFAKAGYEKVIGYPPPQNKLYGYAHYKLGYVFWNTAANNDDYGKAISSFKEVIQFATKYPQLPGATDLANNARRDIIPVYALAGDPVKAHDIFKPLSGDSGAETSRTFKMLDDLGLNYLDTGHYKEGIALYTDLMKRDRGDKYCLYQGRISEATMAINTKNKDVVVAELTKQLAVHKEFLGTASHSAESKAKCSNVTASLVAETAVAWHVEAVGSGGIRGTNDAKTMDHAANLYQKVVENFTSEQFTKFEFPRIVKEDWPTIPKIKYAMADLLYVRKNWEKCGPAFDSVVAEDPTGPQAPEAAFAAVLCYQELYSATHKDGSDRKGSGNLPKGAGKKETQKEKDAKEKAKYAPKEFTKTQEGMITAFNRYLCYIKPSPDQKEDFKNFVEVKYARARTYFEAQRWEEAAAAFREISIDHANMEVGIFAAQLYLESLNVMGSNIEVPRSVCFDDMATDVPKFLDLYCKGGKEKDNAEQCTMLNGIQRDIDRLRAEKYVEEAKNGGANAYALYEKAGRLYEDLWTKYAEAPCAAKDAKGCERADELLYNSAKAYQAARLIAKSISLRKKLLDPTYGLDKGALAMKARYEIGGSYQAIAVYDEAATWYENYAAADPKGEKAADALQDAVVLRLGLGQEDQAIKNADLFNKSYGASKPALAAQIAFAIGEHYADKSDWDQARKRLAGAMGQIDKNATYDIQIQAHALFGRVQSQLNLKSGADTEFKKVAAMWKDPEASLKKIDAASAGPEDKLRRLKKTLTSVGEAFFYFAEQKKAEVDKIKFPEYKGAGNKDDVLKHVNTKVVDWLKKKQPAIEEAEKEYLKVLDLQPSPPPRWVIASGSRVGQMWGKFVAEFRAAPIPKEWKGSGEIPGTNGLTWEEVRGTYYQALDEKSEPQKLRAKAAYKKCLDYSVKYQYFDDYSRKCEQWLSKNYSAEYHLVDEYRGAATRVNTPLKERTRALNADGSFRQEATAAPKPAPEPEAKPAEPSKPGAAKPGDAPASPLDRAQRK